MLTELLGVITVDDVVISKGAEDMVKFGGVEKIRTPYIMVGVFELVKKRIVWLILLCLIEIVVAGMLSFYGKIISTLIATIADFVGLLIYFTVTVILLF